MGFGGINPWISCTEFNDTMTMPNLTFCMDRMHAWSHFNRVGLTAEMIDGAVEVVFGTFLH
jgi:hypothetical protein